MRILVTGGAGFIGSNFIHYMLEKHPDYRIICLDKLTYAGNLRNLESALNRENFHFIKGDICDRELVYRVFEEEKPDVVVNFAAESHVDRSIEDPEIFLKTNIIGTQVLMDACRKYGIKRFHQVSTDEVYGDLPLDRPDLKFTEKSPLKPSSPYSASKASADLLVMAYHRTYGLPVTISRCSNNYGPYQFPEKLIPLMIINAIHDRPLPVYGDGRNVRDWIHVKDHCEAIDIIIHRGKEGEIYNIGGENERANIDVVRMILKELGKPESLIRFVKDRPGHDRRYALDISRMKKEFGWSPKISFEEGLKSTIKWYLENRSWWEEIINGEYMNYYERMYGERLKE
ncbi:MULTISPECIES: dTDP-glucose 4,6-dehydratase [unclassified Thermotoga]|uniref:dTDP-glucose 4,6-dehydratase n=1 Tax=unclassified Thermotoga TaxID=2631113 RepID=UPI000280E6B4|nr:MULTISPECIES: dTDP-glucose 4,6-dehydratase [unclassified Thermotoga]AIY85862.1 dTDP-glucose 4,6-dehydratase [Thermotoga sp. 2812B]EJX26852.1 dTDP-glucose 4,6-dehydratase [Thermotoga sp. EMP]